MDAPVSLESPPCPLCGGETFTTLLRGARDLIWRKPGRFEVQRCDACALVMTRPRPDAESIGFYYEDAYSGEAQAGMRQFQTESWLGRLISRYRLRVLGKVRRPGPEDHLLDVGCSYGGFLRVAREDTACRTSGIDLDAGSIAEAADADLTDYRVGRLVDADYPEGGFTVITFFESLEHHLDPVETLRRAHALLAPGGICAVEVPNFDGFWRRVFRTAWLPLLIPQHVLHFTPRTLRRTFEAAGFAGVEHQQTMFFPFEGVASLGVWLARAVRSPPVGSKPTWRTPFDVALLLILVALYAATEIPTQALLHWFGRSGHQMAIARKAP